MDIEIVDIISEGNGHAYCLRFRANKKFREMRIVTDVILDYLPNVGDNYQDGLRAGEVEGVFLKSLANKEYKYIIQFIKNFLDVQ